MTDGDGKTVYKVNVVLPIPVKREERQDPKVPEARDIHALVTVRAARFDVAISGALVFYNTPATASYPEPTRAFAMGTWLKVQEEEIPTASESELRQLEALLANDGKESDDATA